VGPKYTPQIRMRLLLDQGHTYQGEVDDIGWVSEVDGQRVSCLIRLRTVSPAPVPAPLDVVTFASAKDVLEPGGEGPPVRITGIGAFDVDHRLVRLDSIHDVSVLDNPQELSSLDSRLDEIAAVADGWLDGDGTAPDQSVIKRARRVLADLLIDFDVARPRLFPTPDGGVQAEWALDDRATTLTFEPDGSLYAMSLDVSSGAAEQPQIAEEAGMIARLLGVL
jgi:hypothetical protein